jgi:hypothetical protein
MDWTETEEFFETFSEARIFARTQAEASGQVAVVSRSSEKDDFSCNWDSYKLGQGPVVDVLNWKVVYKEQCFEPEPLPRPDYIDPEIFPSWDDIAPEYGNEEHAMNIDSGWYE